jgi:hypothetical protein
VFDSLILQDMQEAFMEETSGSGTGSRRNEDIALDLMKFVAMSTGYGKPALAGGAGFQGSASSNKPEEYAAQLLELYKKCLDSVRTK